MMSAFLAFASAVADIAPPEPVLRTAARGGDIGVLVASLALGAAVVAAATLLVWRRSGRGVNAGDGEASAVRQAALGGVSLKLALAWASIAGLFVASVLLLGPSRWMGVFAFITLLVLCPLLGGTGAALGGIALAGSGPTPRLRRWRALAGVVINVLPLLFCLLVVVNVYSRTACLIC
jgi:hypothetical protein